MGKISSVIKKRVSNINKLEAGFMIGGGILSYKDSRNQGHGVGYSLGKIVAEELFYATPVGKAALIAQFAAIGAEYAGKIGRENASTSYRAYKANFGGNYKSTQNGYTMRQRGLTAINNAGVNARNALGSEAKMFHRMHYYD